MAYELSFGSVAVTKLCGVCYHLQCRLQEEKKQNRTQEKRKGSDITPPPLFRASGYGGFGLLNRQA